MSPAKASRKGKKAWRRNIDTSQLEQDLTTAQKEEQQGTALQHFCDSALYFVDKAGDEHTASAVAKGLSKKRKQPPKPLRCEVIAGTSIAKQASKGNQSQKPKGQLVLPHVKKQKQLQQQHQGNGVYKLPAKDTFDLWAEQPAVIDPRLDRHNNIPGTIETLATRPVKRQKKAIKSGIKAVPIDPAGCSYNPDGELHEEAVAEAVASEMQKVYRRDLQSHGNIPQFVTYQPETDELALLQVDAELDDEEENDASVLALPSSAEGVEAEGQTKPQREKRHKRDKGLAARNRLLQEEANRKRQLKAQRRDIDNVQQLQQDLEAASVARSEVQASRQAAKQEKATLEPPRLGKVKFEAEPLQVLLSEEVTGSLRKLPATATVTRDRFKSLQKRGIIEPRAAVKNKRPGRRVRYTHGDRAHRAEAGMQELRKLQGK